MKYHGRVEAIEGGDIIGWCTTPDAPHRPQFISVFYGDELIGTAKADLYRPDLLNMGGNGRHGFSFPIPDRFADGVVRILSVFAGPGVDELPGSPVRARLERRSQVTRTASKSGKKYAPRRAAVVCWNLSHNPITRAYLLYKLLEPDWNVEIVGPIWQRFGDDLWSPPKYGVPTTKSFQPSSLIDLWREGASIALAQVYDLVIICKPRLPGLILGLQIAEQSRCPIIVDIDEDDRAFATRRSRSDSDQELIEEPFGKIGTDIAYQYLNVADAITVASPSLQCHFPGRVVRHARDESTPRENREQTRRRFGFTDADFVIAIIGPPQSNEGLSQFFSALKGRADKSVKLLLAKSISGEIDREIKGGGLSEEVINIDDFDQSEFGSFGARPFLAAADLVLVLKGLNAEISKTQIPTQFTDALLYGLRIVAFDAPPFRDVIERGVVDIIKPDEFADYLAKIRSQPLQQMLCDHRKRVFEEEFSFAVNRPRLTLAIEEAFAHFEPSGAKVSCALQELLAKARTAREVSNGLQSEPHLPSSLKGHDTLDFAFFWKQNDSGLFGRRSDMVVKYLLMSERVGKIVHFDHMVSMSDLRSMANAKHRKPQSVAALQLNQTIDRALEVSDEKYLGRRLFICHDGATSSNSFAGRPVVTSDQYAEFVEGALRANGLDPRRTVAWVCPVVRGFADLDERLSFRKVIADLIDDQRTWKNSESEQAAIRAHYESTLRIADLVFTNCEGNRQRFAWARGDIIVVPNGAEIHSSSEPIVMPEQLRTLPRPIIGYMGNLRDRIDWEIVRIITDNRPSWSVVLAGPVEEDRVPNWARERLNLFLPGPVPYEESRSWISSFDVALMPHLKSQMTESMNPLKLYNYLAAGVPVVTTPVANIDEVADLVLIRDTPEDFIKAIKSLLLSPRVKIPSERLDSFSWERRVNAMLSEIEKSL